jgi:hypothetical protein
MLSFILCHDLIQVVAAPEVDEKAAHMSLQLVANHLCDGRKVLAILAHTCTKRNIFTFCPV